MYFLKLDLSDPSLHQELGNPSSRLCLCPALPALSLGSLSPSNNHKTLPGAPKKCWDVQDIVSSCCTALQSFLLPHPLGLRAPPACSDSGKELPAPLTTPQPQLVEGPSGKARGAKGVRGGSPWGGQGQQHRVCALGLGVGSELGAQGAPGHENLPVSYPRASRGQLGATVPRDTG